jgi:hypothetical protein
MIHIGAWRMDSFQMLHGLFIVAFSCALGTIGFSQSNWERGDVFVSTGADSVTVYKHDGTLREMFADGSPSSCNNRGIAIGLDARVFVAAGSTFATIDPRPPHTSYYAVEICDVINAFGIAVNADGEVYVSGSSVYFPAHPPVIAKYDSVGHLADCLNPSERSAVFCDLAADQRTLYYTNRFESVMRFDVSTNTQLDDFATLPGNTRAWGVRLLPPFDGSTGALVATVQNITRLDGAGAVVQTYDAVGENGWVALDLDATGNGFWAGNPSTRRIYRINLASGAIEVGPITVCTGGSCSENCGPWGITVLDVSPTVYVDHLNDTGNETGSQQSPFNTVAEGRDEVALGGTVIIAQGTYHETDSLPLIIERPVVLLANGGIVHIGGP